MRFSLKAFLILVTALIGIGAGAIAVRYHRQRKDMDAVHPVIASLGGRIGSIPFEPFGTEYRIKFENHRFTQTDLEQLAALRGLSERNAVFLMFVNCGLEARDIERLRELLPNVKVLPITDDPKP